MSTSSVEELHRRFGFVAEREAKAAECTCECQRQLRLAELLRAIGPCKEMVPGNGELSWTDSRP